MKQTKPIIQLPGEGRPEDRISEDEARQIEQGLRDGTLRIRSIEEQIDYLVEKGEMTKERGEQEKALRRAGKAPDQIAKN